MIDLVLKLVDRLIDLAKRHEEVNRALFVNFIQPAFQTFEIIHADYIDSPVRYNSRLADKTLTLDLNHRIFADIELDALKTQHLRTKLRDFRPKESSPKIQGFLTAIDLYLRGVSASRDNANLITKVASGALESLTVSDMRGVMPSGPPIEVVRSSDGHLISDPLRWGLHKALFGIDSAMPETAEPCDEKEFLDDVKRDLIMFTDDVERRALCLRATRDAMRYFQASYGVVSSEYSKLRSELMIAQ